MLTGRPRAVLPLCAALAVLAAGLQWQRARHAERLERYDRFTLPGYDARVYLAMAEEPAVFTVAPWGYRVLGPWLLHRLRPQPERSDFERATHLLLLAGGVLLYLWLRRLGHAPIWAAVGVAWVGFTPPLEQAVSNPFLVDPWVWVLLLGLLWLLEARAGYVWLALAGALGALSKELYLFFLPLVFLVRRAHGSSRTALTALAACSVPALGATWLLRATWGPAGEAVSAVAVTPSAAGTPAEVFWLALWRILFGWRGWLGEALLAGATPLALWAALRRPTRPFLAAYGWLLAVGWALPFAASVYTDDPRQVPFFATDVPRLLIYALPAMLHLALVTLQQAWARLRAPTGTAPACPPEPAALRARWTRLPAAVVLILTLAFPLLALDRYRRLDLRGRRDGPLLLAFTRQSLAWAHRLQAGRPVAYEVAARRFRPGRDEPRYLERMRWFLRDGWGTGAPYAVGPAAMGARRARLVLPCLEPADWMLTLHTQAARALGLAVDVNGRPLGTLELAAGAQRTRLAVPRAVLWRGDNLLGLEQAAPEGDLVALELLDLRLQPGGP